MKCPVFYQGEQVGWVLTEQVSGCVRWEAVCRVETNRVLRLYGRQAEREPFRVGVMEPEDGGNLHLCRKVWQSELEGAGYAALPNTYFLGEQGQERLHTGDAKIDACIDSGQVVCRLCDGVVCVSAPFSSAEPCPLAFALTACTVEQGRAVLRGNRTGLFKPRI